MRIWYGEDYGGAPGNQCVMQHPRTGFIYVGNNLGVLEFDGARWRLIRTPIGSVVRTLALDGRGVRLERSSRPALARSPSPAT